VIPVPKLRIQLLGPFQVSVDAWVVPERAWRSHRATALVKLLALAPDHRLHREVIMEILWPELDFDDQANNLNVSASRARRALATVGAPPGHFLVRSGNHLLLGPPDRIRVDVATGQNLSLDPATGEATAGGQLAYARGDPNAAATPRVVAAAYTPDGDLFAVDVATGVLARQTPANAGTLTTIGPLGVTLTDGASFDIAGSGEALLASPG